MKECKWAYLDILSWNNDRKSWTAPLDIILCKAWWVPSTKNPQGSRSAKHHTDKRSIVIISKMTTHQWRTKHLLVGSKPFNMRLSLTKWRPWWWKIFYHDQNLTDQDGVSMESGLFSVNKDLGFRTISAKFLPKLLTMSKIKTDWGSYRPAVNYGQRFQLLHQSDHWRLFLGCNKSINPPWYQTNRMKDLKQCKKIKFFFKNSTDSCFLTSVASFTTSMRCKWQNLWSTRN